MHPRIHDDVRKARGWGAENCKGTIIRVSRLEMWEIRLSSDTARTQSIFVFFGCDFVSFKINRLSVEASAAELKRSGEQIVGSENKYLPNCWWFSRLLTCDPAKFLAHYVD